MRYIHRAAVLIAALLMLLSLFGCGGPKRLVHCDRCGAEIYVKEDSNVTEDWILFCKKCEKEIGPIIGE